MRGLRVLRARSEEPGGDAGGRDEVDGGAAALADQSLGIRAGRAICRGGRVVPGVTLGLGGSARIRPFLFRDPFVRRTRVGTSELFSRDRSLTLSPRAASFDAEGLRRLPPSGSAPIDLPSARHPCPAEGMNRNTKPPHVSRLLPSPWPGLFAVALESAHRFPRHFHRVYGVGIIDEGAHRSGSRLGEVDAFPGDLITTNPGDVHDGRPLGCERRRWRIVYVEPSLLLAETADEGVPGDLPEPVQGAGPFACAVHLLLHRLECSSAGTLDVLACEEAFQALLAFWPREGATLGRSIEPARFGAASRVEPAIERVREQLAADGAAPPSLATLAASAGLSRFQVLRRFQAQLGMPPHAWRLALNAERARGHIDRGCSLADAAALAGFSDQSHLTRIFVRQFGFTPGAYRRARQRWGRDSAQ